MKDEDVERGLRDLGLSGHQARVYLQALEQGSLTGAQLAEKARVPRAKVYQVCGELIDKGLLESESGVPRRFRALPLARHVEQRRSELHREATDLEKRQRDLEPLLPRRAPRSASDSGGLAVLQGEGRVATHLRMMVRGASQSLHVLLADGALPLLGLVLEEKAPATALQVVHRLTSEDLPRARRLAERGVDLRHSKASLPITTVTCDGNHTLLLLHPESGQHPTRGLWSSEPTLIATEEERFASAWKKAISFARWEKGLFSGRERGTTELLGHEEGHGTGSAAFAAMCLTALGGRGAQVDLALGAPFLGVVEDPRLQSLLANHRARLLVPFPREPGTRALAEAASALGETRQAPPWLGEQALLVVNDTSLIASVDPESGQLETLIASSEPGLVRWLGRVFEVGWQMAEEPRPQGREPVVLWNVTHRAAEAEVFLRQVLAIATRVVEVRGPEPAKAIVTGLVEDPKVQVRRLPPPPHAQNTLFVSVDDRLLLLLEGVEFSPRGDPRLLRAVDACVLTDSRALLAVHQGLPSEDGAQG